MKTVIYPGVYNGKLIIPASKSYMQRALAIALLAKGTTKLKNVTLCEDTQAVIKMIRSLGAKVKISSSEIQINSNGEIKKKTLLAGESGLGTRLFIPICALYDEEITIKGKGSLRKRPMDIFVKPLQTLGVNVDINETFLPLKIKGPLNGGKCIVDGELSSQIVTGFLIALPKVKKASTVVVPKLNSIPYIDISIDIMKKFGVRVVHRNYKVFYIKGNQNYYGRTYKIEGDWSSATFHLIAGAIKGCVKVYGLNIKSKQADLAILEVLRKVGAQLDINSKYVEVKKKRLNSFVIDATHSPDLFPALAVLATQCEGTSIIYGVSRLIYKESNRLDVLYNVLKQQGIEIKIIKNSMHIKRGMLKGGAIHSNNDHRIAMMAAVIGLISKSPVEIIKSESVNKSYPNFFRDFKRNTKQHE